MPLLTLALLSGCDKQVDAPAKEPAAASDRLPVVFPTDLHVADAQVNAFVEQAIVACLSGDYDRFRALWSVAEVPFAHDQYERGWRSVEGVEVLDLREMRDPRDDSTLYYIHARVELVPDTPKPRREVVLLIIREGDAWRLAKAPSSLVDRVFGSRPPPGGAANESESADGAAAKRPTTVRPEAGASATHPQAFDSSWNPDI